MTPSALPQRSIRTPLRRMLLAQRHALSAALHLQLSTQAQQSLLAWLAENSQLGDVVALYAAHQRELDLLTQSSSWPKHLRIALPVVRAKQAPLHFARWQFDQALQIDAYGIAIPTVTDWLIPNIIVLPCLGFHQASRSNAAYRLGYGGGYYDRTITQLRSEGKAVLTVGLAFASSACAFEAQAHDVPLDHLITV